MLYSLIFVLTIAGQPQVYTIDTGLTLGDCRAEVAENPDAGHALVCVREPVSGK